MVGVGAFVGFKRSGEVVVVGGDGGGELGFFESVVDDLMSVTYPATRWLVALGGV